MFGKVGKATIQGFSIGVEVDGHGSWELGVGSEKVLYLGKPQIEHLFKIVGSTPLQN
jgi:hypothetical protein